DQRHDLHRPRLPDATLEEDHHRFASAARGPPLKFDVAYHPLTKAEWSKMVRGRFRPHDLLLLSGRRRFAAVAPDPQRASIGGAPEARKTRILILGGGFGGVYTARHLEKLCKRRPEVETVLVSRDNFLLLTP